MKPTLGIYGIQDRSDNEWPEYIHDHSLTYMQDGNILYHNLLERITGVKHDNKLHKRLYRILKESKLISKDYDIIFTDSVVGRSFISAQGNIRFEAPLFPGKLKQEAEQGYCWWIDKEVKAYIINHELAHIYSCLPFFGPFRDKSLLVHFDGGASISNFSAWLYKNEKMTLLGHHWKLKYLSSLFNANALMFKMLNIKRKDHNSLPGKLMGYASYGNYRPEMEEWLKNNDYFSNIWRNKSLFFNAVRKSFSASIQHFNTHDTFFRDIAATVQHIFTRDFLSHLKNIVEQTNAENLYYTGGSALNIMTNSAITESGLFSNMFIPPCTNDTGLSIGAAAYHEQKKGNAIKIHSPFLNNHLLEDYTWDSQERKKRQQLLKTLCYKIAQGKIIGLCNESGESGPRAVGNRSVIARPDSIDLAKKVSMICKRREWYRPVAPVMLEKNTRYFVLKEHIHHLSKYMLLNFFIPEKRRTEIAGTVHVDGTARIQTIFNREQHHFLYDLLVLLDGTYQMKALINTSFNVRGKPMVHSREDAFAQAKEMKLDAVVINYEYIEL